MDSCCFAAFDSRQDYPNEIKQLIEWNNKGWVDLIKSDVLEKETEQLLEESAARTSLKNKTKTLATDYGIPLLQFNRKELVSHTSSN